MSQINLVKDLKKIALELEANLHYSTKDFWEKVETESAGEHAGVWHLEAPPYLLQTFHSSWCEQGGYDAFWFNTFDVAQLETFLDQLREEKLEPGTYAPTVNMDDIVRRMFDSLYDKMIQEIGEDVKRSFERLSPEKQDEFIDTISEDYGWDEEEKKSFREEIESGEGDLDLCWSANTCLESPLYDTILEDLENRKNKALKEIAILGKRSS